MTCTHIRQVVRKMNELIEKIGNENGELYKDLGTYHKVIGGYYRPGEYESNCGTRKTYGEASSGNVLSSELNLKAISERVLGEYLSEIAELINDCNCYSELAKNAVNKEAFDELMSEYKKNIKDYNNLTRNSVSKETYEEMKEKWKKDVDDYNELLRKHRVLEEKCKNLIEKLEEYGEYKDMYENTRNERENERVNNTQEIATLRQENLGLKGQLTRTQNRLTASENKVARIEDKLEARNREILELKDKLEKLNINVNNLEKSREELLNEKVNLKNEKLEAFAGNSGINLDEVNDLLRYYERLIHARKNYNQVNIETHEGNINRVKRMLRQNGVNIVDAQKCCRKCEKIAKLRVELNEIRQQQYDARQEVPPR